MTFYEREIKRIRSVVYSNQRQVDTVVGIRKYIENNYDEDLNLNLLSHIRFVSKFHLLRLFTKYYGQTPKQYLINRRIEKSKEYLKKGMNITETCFAVGFESPASFSTLFKNRTGLTPTEFQKKQFSQSKLDANVGALPHYNKYLNK
ncbi:MAG TPA: AraC family transcriptional regulator [Ginsengibacter sp.]|nr:AraC family transcriptional regulator [Ginsengibacter sp.]